MNRTSNVASEDLPLLHSKVPICLSTILLSTHRFPLQKAMSNGLQSTNHDPNPLLAREERHLLPMTSTCGASAFWTWRVGLAGGLKSS